MCDGGIFIAGYHRLRFRVYYEDTDAGGVVYHANYLKFAERARTEMFHHCGDAYARMIASGDLAFAVRSCMIDYLAPARLDDMIEVASQVTEIGGARIRMRQIISRDENVLVEISILLACINAAGRVSRMPRAVRHVLLPLVSLPEKG